MSDTAPRQLTAYESTKQTLVAMQGQIAAHPPSSIPFLALGAWVLAVGAAAAGNTQPAPPLFTT